MKQRGFAPIIILLLIALGVGIGMAWPWLYRNYIRPIHDPISTINPPGANPLAKRVACTQEAKLCPDGSYVSRIGPNCEFTPCPTTNTLVPADAKTPAAGVCATVTGKVVTVTLNIDVPSPRCTIVNADQTLDLVNGTDRTINLNYATFKSPIYSHSGYSFPGNIGSFFAPGVHVITTSLYGGSGPEVWLQ
jgi:hypothetical protein